MVGWLGFAPPNPPTQQHITELQPPPPTEMLHVASLGRPQAAADILWLQVVSFVGSGYSEATGYLGIEHYLDRITDLAPNFSLPYWIGGILLATSPERTTAADKILAKGEQKFPDDWEFSQWRGFVAYFGEMNIPKALVHYKNAVKKPGHAPYLKSFIQRLERASTDCTMMSENMSQLLSAGGPTSTQEFLQGRAGKIIKNCVKMNLKQAAASFRLRHGRIAMRVQDLLDYGIIDKMPPTPPGYCWSIIKKTDLHPCEEVEAEIKEVQQKMEAE
ncbi:MAG: hypothetical protein CMH56_04315 [Myxococcales bacterium]|nr:hypothetical protein [Myxococcales bacterium]